jgi:hypothetical protein
MKTFYLILGIWMNQITVAQNSNSIHQSGIYMTWENYLNGKLSCTQDCDSPLGKIKLNHFFSGNYVEVYKGEEKIKLQKDSIFGYLDCNQKAYRFYKSYDSEYLIAENKTIVIYTCDIPVAFSSGKRNRLVPMFFFSTSLQTGIYPLTVINLKKAFPGNLKLHDLLDVEFDGIKDISVYDSLHQTYKVNFLFSQSLTNN